MSDQPPIPPSDAEASAVRPRPVTARDRVETVGGLLWFGALVVAFVSPALGHWVIYPLLALALGGLVLMGGAHLDKKWSGVEQEPEELSRALDESRASKAVELPPGSDEPRPPLWKAFLGRFIEQLENLVAVVTQRRSAIGSRGLFPRDKWESRFASPTSSFTADRQLLTVGPSEAGAERRSLRMWSVGRREPSLARRTFLQSVRSPGCRRPGLAGTVSAGWGGASGCLRASPPPRQVMVQGLLFRARLCV
jgi:hypothetical protein